MSAADFAAWLAHMRWSDSEAARQLGCARNSIIKWKRAGAPTYIGLAASALAFGLPPWRGN